MLRFTACLTLVLGTICSGAGSAQDDRQPSAKVVASHGYERAVVLTRGDARAVLCPEIGGRVLEFSVGGKQALWFDEQEQKRDPGKPPPSSAGRFDFGPELTTPQHPQLWSGPWTAEITGESSVRLVSQQDEASGVQLIRDFDLTVSPAKAPTSGLGFGGSAGASPSEVPRLLCKQTIVNISNDP